MMTKPEQYPRGKLCDDDEGSTSLSMGVVDKTLIIQFAEPMYWLGMDINTAKEFVNLLNKNIAKLEEELAKP